MDDVYTEFCTMREVLQNVSDEEYAKMETFQKWRKALSAAKATQLLKVAQYVLSIPANNAYVERVFSVMGNLWTDERNRMSVSLVRAEIIVFFDFELSCERFLEYVRSNLLEAICSEKKYKFKRNIQQS
jgi:hypothetical protein